MRRFLIALQFLTRFPLKLASAPCPEETGQSMIYFPLVGLCLGVYWLALDWLLTRILPPIMVDLLLVLGLILATGAMHLDGLADTADGFYAGHALPPGAARRARILEVMKDSRIGVMGVLAVLCVLSLKVFALNSLPLGGRASLLLLTPTLSRWYLVWAAAFSEYARQRTAPPDAFSRLGEPFTQAMDGAQLAKASPLPCLLTVWLLGSKGIFLLGFSLAAAGCLIRYCRQKIGGMSGDTFGALNEVMEVVTLILALVII